MPNLPRLASGLLLSASLAGCASDARYAAADAGPNPRPPPGYRVVCSTFPGVTNPFFASYYASCQPVLDPVPRRAVVRAKG